MTDVAYWAESYGAVVDELERLVHRLESSDGSVAECEAKLKRAKDVQKSFSLELRLLRDKFQKLNHDATLKKLNDRLADLSGKIAFAKNASDRHALFAAKDAKVEVKSNNDYLTAAEHLQDQTGAALQRTLALIEASKEVGTSTLEELERQHEQIKDITADVLIIDDNLKRADRLIRNFAKRMMTDRIIQTFCFLNLCALCGIIAYAVVTKKSIGGKNKSSTNNTPQGE
ncbi:hypothetical protein M885DRAFT_513060 [Pelagophyceae sp. CCMP2097]|nr:hypothetical protein M885DRAFT_513060 [Pelagophyceae sp. CCMP2097]